MDKYAITYSNSNQLHMQNERKLFYLILVFTFFWQAITWKQLEVE